ncbi:MAG TPA: YihY family inner membrane protein [Pseudomonadales bacterium]|nr:YihY family inner membrane protein [Pseudomonadales bacterium]
MKKWAEYWRFFMIIWRRFWSATYIDDAAVLTFTTLFAVVPLMTVTYSLLSWIPSLRDEGQQVQEFVFRHFLPGSGAQILPYLQGFSQQAQRLTLLGIGMLVVTSMGLLWKVEVTFNRMWGEAPPRNRLTLLRHWATLSLGPLLLATGMVLSSQIATVSWVRRFMGSMGIGHWSLNILPTLLSTIAFTMFYLAVPKRSVEFKYGLAGGVLAATLFELLKNGFSLFVAQFPAYRLVYGAFAVVPIFLVWIFISWLILLFGMEFVRGLTLRREVKRDERDELVGLISLLHVFGNAQREGKSLDDPQVLASLPHWAALDVEGFRLKLQHMGLVQRLESGEYCLVRSLDNLTLAELIEGTGAKFSLGANDFAIHEDDHPELQWALKQLQIAQHSASGSLQWPLSRLWVEIKPTH